MIRILPTSILIAICLNGFSQSANKPVASTIEGNIFKPAKAQPTEDNISRLKLPAGFGMKKFAKNLGAQRMIAVSPQNYVYISRPDSGDVLLLADKNKDGRADNVREVAQVKDAHGLAVHNGKLYIAAVTKIYQAAIRPNGQLDNPKVIIEGLPDGGQRPNRTIAFGPDEQLYITIGSTCNACEETNPESATVLRVKADFSGREVFAKGLRNTIGFDWHPETKALYGMDHGIDWLGDNK